MGNVQGSKKKLLLAASIGKLQYALSIENIDGMISCLATIFGILFGLVNQYSGEVTWSVDIVGKKSNPLVAAILRVRNDTTAHISSSKFHKHFIYLLSKYYESTLDLVKEFDISCLNETLTWLYNNKEKVQNYLDNTYSTAMLNTYATIHDMTIIDCIKQYQEIYDVKTIIEIVDCLEKDGLLNDITF